jgi:hypothetical protein
MFESNPFLLDTTQYNNPYGGNIRGYADFPDPYAGLVDEPLFPKAKGAGGANIDANAAIQGITGAASIFMDNHNAIQQAKGINTNVASPYSDAYGRPIYNLGEDVARMQGINPKDAGKGLIGRSAVTGASTGAAIGSVIPGVGTAIGAGVGAVVGAGAGLIGRTRARNKARDRKKTLGTNIQAAQYGFNDASNNYSELMQARNAYRSSQTQLFSNPMNLPSQYSTFF